MKERQSRLKSIKKIIKGQKVESQEELSNCLRLEGHSVTQATLSRDLKLLKVGKVSDGNSAYYYALPDEEERVESEKSYIQDFLRGYISIDWSLNLVVVRTFSGHSDTVALAIDNLGIDDILGTIAGRDNTVFIALREGYSGEDFMRDMKERIPELED